MAAIRSERALRSAAGAVRALHDATEGFTPPDSTGWDRQEATLPVDVDWHADGVSDRITVQVIRYVLTCGVGSRPE